MGGFLVALSTFQGEFDFGVPQFRPVLHPILIMLAAGVGLVAARIYLGRGGALLAVLGFLLIRGFLAIMVGGVWDQTTPHFPLYIVEALLVEAVFLRAAAAQPDRRGASPGVLIGTVGLAAEWAWSHVWMPIPWSSALLPEAAIVGVVTAVAAGVVGGFVGGALTSRPARSPPTARRSPIRARGSPAPETRRARRRPAADGGVGWNLPMSEERAEQRDGRPARRLQPGPGARSRPTCGCEPAGSVDDPEFSTSPPGRGRERGSPRSSGRPRACTARTRPIPCTTSGRPTSASSRGDALVAVPIYLPEDRAIPAPEGSRAGELHARFRPDLEVSSASAGRRVGLPHEGRVPHRARDRPRPVRAARVGSAAWTRGGRAAGAGRFEAHRGRRPPAPNLCESALKKREDACRYIW